MSGSLSCFHDNYHHELLSSALKMILSQLLGFSVITVQEEKKEGKENHERAIHTMLVRNYVLHRQARGRSSYCYLCSDWWHIVAVLSSVTFTIFEVN